MATATADTPCPTRPALLTQALPDLAAWTRHLCIAEVPVLAATAQALAELREREDDIAPGDVATLIESDPLMTVKFMAYAAITRGSGEHTATETVTSSLVMTGIGPFFRHFGPQLTLEDWLGDLPEALEALQGLVERGRRAAHFAMAFAVHRCDTDAQVIHSAAFLHDFAEMLMWCHAPALMLQIRHAQQADPALRSAAIQREVLHTDLNDLRQALLKLWHLPELLVRISDDRHADHPSVRNVVLAARLARHTQHGWSNPAVPDDVAAIAELLNSLPRVAEAFLHKVDLRRYDPDQGPLHRLGD